MNEDVFEEKCEDIKEKEKVFSENSKENLALKRLSNIDLNEVKENLKRIPVRPFHNMNSTNGQVFNAFADNVILVDNNGEEILVDNKEQITLQQMKNSGKLEEYNRQLQQGNNPNTSSDYFDDDDIDFDED